MIGVDNDDRLESGGECKPPNVARPSARTRPNRRRSGLRSVVPVELDLRRSTREREPRWLVRETECDEQDKGESGGTGTAIALDEGKNPHGPVDRRE